MTSLTKKTIFSIVSVSILALAVLSINMIGNTNDVAASISEMTIGKGIGLTSSPQEHLDQDVNSVIVVSSDGTQQKVSKGAVTKIAFTVTHVAGKNPVPQITLSADGIKGQIIPPSVLSRTTVDERVQELKTTGKISGAVDLSPLVRFVPPIITLAPGESKTIEMIVTVPPSWQDELTGKVIDFEPNIRRTGDYEGYKIAVFSTSIPAIIGE